MNCDLEPVPTLAYYRRILSAYVLGGKSQLTFWHETPTENPNANPHELAEYYMLFAEKADYPGHYDASGVPRSTTTATSACNTTQSLSHNMDSATTTFGAARLMKIERRSSS